MCEADWDAIGAPSEDGPFYCGYWFDSETGNDLVRNRYYTVALATWLSRDPIQNGAAQTNLYQYVFNNPVLWTDSSGLWGDGNAAGGKGDGHSDFPGYPEFDWTKEDHGTTNPMINPGPHFRSLDDSESDLMAACDSCNYDKFIRAGHDMQDFFSHYGQGYRVVSTGGHVPGTVIQTVVAACGMPNTPPDDAKVYRDAYKAAKERTQMWLDRWDAYCEKGAKGVWKPKSPQPNLPRPANPYGDKAPPPTPDPGWGAGFMDWLEKGVCKCYGARM